MFMYFYLILFPSFFEWKLFNSNLFHRMTVTWERLPKHIILTPRHKSKYAGSSKSHFTTDIITDAFSFTTNLSLSVMLIVNSYFFSLSLSVCPSPSPVPAAVCRDDATPRGSDGRRPHAHRSRAQWLNANAGRPDASHPQRAGHLERGAAHQAEPGAGGGVRQRAGHERNADWAVPLQCGGVRFGAAAGGWSEACCCGCWHHHHCHQHVVCCQNGWGVLVWERKIWWVFLCTRLFPFFFVCLFVCLLLSFLQMECVLARMNCRSGCTFFFFFLYKFIHQRYAYLELIFFSSSSISGMLRVDVFFFQFHPSVVLCV